MLPTSSEGLLAFEQVLRSACALVRPPEKVSVAEWIDKYAYLSPEGSARPGKWRISTAEYQRYPLEMLSPGSPYETVVLIWPSQVGKTQIGLGLTAYHIRHDPAPILFMEPDEGLAKTISKDRIDPLIRDTPMLREVVPTGRASGNDIFHKSFPGGHLTMAWASSSSQTASRPIRILITDEEDRPGYDLNPEGDALGQAEARMATFEGNRKHARISSPGLRRTSKILRGWENSEKHRYHVPCPQCGHSQTLRWEQLKWPPGQPQECYYVCEANGCVITEADKHRMIAQGQWRPELDQRKGGKNGLTIGFHINALYSTIGYKWSALVAEYLACEGIPDKLQVFVNTKLAEPWDEAAEGADMGALQRRAEAYPAPAPAWVLMITIGADVQRDRIEASKWGYGEHDVCGVLEHRVFRGDTSQASQGAWRDFDEWRKGRTEHEYGAMVATSCTFVDSSDGNRTQTVYEYCKAREREHVYPIKGSSQPGAPLVNRGSRQGRMRALLVIVGTSTAKDTLFARLQIDDPARPGYIHFPANAESGCDEAYYKHLTSERLVTRHTRTGEVSEWVNPPGARNEALDCAVYALAAMAFTGRSLRTLARQLEARIAQLKEAGQWPVRPAAPASTPALPSSGSSASSPASPSPTPKLRKKGRKVVRRPGFGWIHG